jgi:hypothetical protein
LLESDVKVLVFLQNRTGIVGIGAGIQHRQDGTPQQRVHATFPMLPKLFRFDLRQDLKTPFGPDFGVDRFITIGAQ